jgi:hypothetical protein
MPAYSRRNPRRKYQHSGSRICQCLISKEQGMKRRRVGLVAVAALAVAYGGLRAGEAGLFGNLVAGASGGSPSGAPAGAPAGAQRSPAAEAAVRRWRRPRYGGPHDRQADGNRPHDSNGTTGRGPSTQTYKLDGSESKIQMGQMEDNRNGQVGRPTSSSLPPRLNRVRIRKTCRSPMAF